MDFSGRNNGQIKVNVHLLSTIPDRNVYTSNQSATVFDNSGTVNTTKNVTNPLSVEVDENDFSNQLGRALKRKFTELEEISQRLKARLFDITAEAEQEDFDPDDEFERDLNTVVESDDDDVVSREDFGWLGQDKAIFTTTGFNHDPENMEQDFDNVVKNVTEMDVATALQLGDIEKSVDLFKSILTSSSENNSQNIPSTSQGIGHLSQVLKKTSLSDDPRSTKYLRENPDGEDKEDSC